MSTYEHTILDFSCFPSLSDVPPNKSVFVTKVGSTPEDSIAVEESDRDSPAFRFLQSQDAIQIDLSAAAFDYGTAIGPDSTGWISRWRAYIEAEQSVFERIARSPPGSLSRDMSSLVTVASEVAKRLLHLERDGDLDFGALFEAWRRSDNYPDQYTLRAGISALRLLAHAERNGESHTKELAMRELSSKQYPVIHR